MKDEAYLFFENNLYPYFTDTITIQYQQQTDSTQIKGIYELPLKNKKNQYEFGGQLFESINRGDESVCNGAAHIRDMKRA